MLALSVPYEGWLIQKHSMHTKLDTYHWVDTPANWLLITEGNIRYNSQSFGTDMVYCIYVLLKLQFLNNDIIIKTNIHPWGTGNIGRLRLQCIGPLAFLLLNILELSAFPIFWPLAYMLKVIPDTRRVY
jgi:hypothetical protein